MAIQYIGKGGFGNGTGSISCTVPTGYALNDLLVLFVESANQVIATPSGWTEITDSPQFRGTAATAGGVRLAIFYKFAGSTESTLAVADSGNHTTGIMTCWRGVDTTTPINITAGAIDSANTLSKSCPSVTTTVAEAMIINAIGLDRDAASTTNLSEWANENLVSITELHDQTISGGVGGGLGIAYGVKATAGSTGNTTATSAVSLSDVYITLALTPYIESYDFIGVAPVEATTTDITSTASKQTSSSFDVSTSTTNAATAIKNALTDAALLTTTDTTLAYTFDMTQHTDGTANVESTSTDATASANKNANTSVDLSTLTDSATVGTKKANVVIDLSTTTNLNNGAAKNASSTADSSTITDLLSSQIKQSNNTLELNTATDITANVTKLTTSNMVIDSTTDINFTTYKSNSSSLEFSVTTDNLSAVSKNTSSTIVVSTTTDSAAIGTALIVIDKTVSFAIESTTDISTLATKSSTTSATFETTTDSAANITKQSFSTIALDTTTSSSAITTAKRTVSFAIESTTDITSAGDKNTSSTMAIESTTDSDFVGFKATNSQVGLNTTTDISIVAAKYTSASVELNTVTDNTVIGTAEIIIDKFVSFDISSTMSSAATASKDTSSSINVEATTNLISDVNRNSSTDVLMGITTEDMANYAKGGLVNFNVESTTDSLATQQKSAIGSVEITQDFETSATGVLSYQIGTSFVIVSTTESAATGLKSTSYQILLDTTSAVLEVGSKGSNSTITNNSNTSINTTISKGSLANTLLYQEFIVLVSANSVPDISVDIGLNFVSGILSEGQKKTTSAATLDLITASTLNSYKGANSTLIESFTTESTTTFLKSSFAAVHLDIITELIIDLLPGIRDIVYIQGEYNPEQGIQGRVGPYVVVGQKLIVSLRGKTIKNVLKGTFGEPIIIKNKDQE